MPKLDSWVSNVNDRITIGSDPEFFIRGHTSGEVIPAFTFLPAEDTRESKDKPFYDGFQAEVTPTENSCLAWHVDAIRNRILDLHTYAERVGGFISFEDSVDIPTLGSYGDAQTQLGCSPSLSAYDEASSLPPNPASILWRSAGCHIHLGIEDKQSLHPKEFVQLLDAVTGPIYTSLLEGLESPRRRQMYGRAGEYRVKGYGIEYRVPAPGSLIHPVVAHIVFDTAKGLNLLAQAASGVDRINYVERFLQTIHHSGQEVKGVINTCDVLSARKLIKESLNFYQEFYSWIYGSRSLAVMKLITDGAQTRFSATQYEENWKLKQGKILSEELAIPIVESPSWILHSEAPNCSVATWEM